MHACIPAPWSWWWSWWCRWWWWCCSRRELLASPVLLLQHTPSSLLLGPSLGLPLSFKGNGNLMHGHLTNTPPTPSCWNGCGDDRMMMMMLILWNFSICAYRPLRKGYVNVCMCVQRCAFLFNQYRLRFIPSGLLGLCFFVFEVTWKKIRAGLDLDIPHSYWEKMSYWCCTHHTRIYTTCYWCCLFASCRYVHFLFFSSSKLLGKKYERAWI